MKGIEEVRQMAASVKDVKFDQLARQASQVVSALREAGDLRKQASDVESEVKGHIKSMCFDVMESRGSVTIYDFEGEGKVSLTPVGGGINVSEEGVLASLYEAYGEERGDKDGQAWATWCMMTRPVEQPRVMDQMALETLLRVGDEDMRKVVSEALAKNTKEVPPTYRVDVRAMTKAEKSAVERGELTDPVVVR